VAVTTGPCFAGPGMFDLYVAAFGIKAGAAFLSSSDGTCSGGLRGFTTALRSPDEASAAVACAGLDPTKTFAIRMTDLYPAAPGDAWLCA